MMETVVLDSFLHNWLAMAVDNLIMAYVLLEEVPTRLQFIWMKWKSLQ